MGLTTKDLYEIGRLNTDEVAGFQAQLSSGRSKLEALWPEHLKGKRVDDFRRGSSFARDWLAIRRAYAKARRSARMRDFRTIGMTTTFLPEHAERKEEQLEALRTVTKHHNKRDEPQ